MCGVYLGILLLLYLTDLGKDNLHCPPSPVSSSYSELQKAASYEDDAKDFDNSSSQVSLVNNTMDH